MDSICRNQWKTVLLAKGEVLNLNKSSKISYYKMFASHLSIS